MGDTVRKAGYYFFLIAFTALIVYVIVTDGAAYRRAREYDAQQTAFQDTPEMRTDAIYFNKLDRRCQYVYDVLLDTIKKGDEFTPEMPLLLTEQELSDTVRALLYDTPSLFYVDEEGFDLKNHGYTEKKNKTGYLVVVPSVTEEKYTRVHIPYIVKNDGSSGFLEKANVRFNAALKKADDIISDVHDSYLICRLIHDYLTGICSRTVSGGVYADTAYGALIEGEATSLGYAKAFKLLYERYSGICCIAEGGGEYWNVALVDDKYYNIDVYSDDLDGQANGKTLRGVSSHLYLCLDDDTFYLEHQRGDMPAVCSDKTSYLIYCGAYATTPAGLESVSEELTEQTVSARRVCFEICSGIEGAEDVIRSAVLETLKKNYPERTADCLVFRISEKIPVYTVYIYDAAPEGE